MIDKSQNAAWNFDNSYSRLPEIFFSKIIPSAASSPKLVVFNDKLADSLGLNTKFYDEKRGADIFSGNEIPSGAFPIAQAYAGHQFGYFTMLGDGRAMLLVNI